MEQAGIYYFFSHDQSKHTLVLADSISAHSDAGAIPFRLPGTAGAEDEAFIDEWHAAGSIQSGQVTLNDFDFERPRANLEVRALGSAQYLHGKAEIYDYPGLYTQTDDGQSYARTRLEGYQAQSASVSGHGNVIPLAVGDVFTLNGHARSDQNKGHLLTAARYAMENSSLISGGQAQSARYEYHFTAIGKQVPFRLPLRTPKPIVQGPQTALVVGKSGEEIWTDKYGRINVQFHWDRKGKNDEKSSCWVRVAQPWAGSQFGAIMLPRIGQEVVIDFLEGDPDRPIVTGRVYNASNMPPYTLPDNATQSGVKTNSSKGGSGANEIRFEDKKGSEELFINAQKDMNLVVLNNQTETIDADQTVKISKTRKTEIGSDRTEKISNNDSLEVGGARSIKVSGDNSAKISGASTHKTDGNITLDSGDSLTIKAANQITLSCGSAKITLSSSGDISITGMNVTLSGTSGVTAKSDAQMQIQGMQTSVKGTMLTLQADGIASLSGSLTKIG
jgi:type VI secretion system secreted protein VgrG